MATPTPRAIVSKVRTFVRRHDVLRPGPLVLAVSGGTDSTALALILAELAAEFGVVLHVAQFDHGTRPADAAADAQFVADLAARIGAPLRLGRAARVVKSEDDARRERYAFLRRAAEHVGAAAIATGHTLDDQAETVLLHLVRGSGLTGAAGMRPLRDGIARPLLAIPRSDTSAICRAAGIVPREDPTNASLRFARNRIRLRVLPELEALNPKVREALARFADAAADVDAALEHAAGDETADANAIDLRDLPTRAAIRGRLLAAAYREATGSVLTERHRAALVSLAGTTDGTRRIDLPGATAVREYARLRFLRPAAARRRAAGEAEKPLVRGSSVEWHGWRIALGMERSHLPYTASVDTATASRLVVRSRRPGDRVSERGKLQDVFVNAKVPARLRDRWPLVTLDGTVLWVPGVTAGPRTGRIALAAGPVGDDLTDTKELLGRSAPFRQVASLSEARPQGGKRGRP
ncbi:MAG TPA: tRNA lysidine(34) synthetase TilS [Candidatus Limnocylindria bacterium]